MSDVFIYSKEKEKTVTQTVNSYFGRRTLPGRFGFELECEAENRLPDRVPPTFTAKRDGSLRIPTVNGSTVEYVFTNPLDKNDASVAIQELFEGFKIYKTKLHQSYRTSTHVHLNVGDWSLGRVTAFCCLWFIFEDLLATFSGPMRKGNLFALRAKDAKALLTPFETMVRNNNYGVFREDNAKYAGLNGFCLSKFGSLEVRVMRGLDNAADCIQWLHILDCFYEASGKYTNDPREIYNKLSCDGPEDFLRSIIGNELYLIILNDENVRWSEEEFVDSVYEGVRNSQQIAFAREWQDVVEMKKDPFNRKARREHLQPLRIMDDQQLIAALRGARDGIVIQDELD